MVTRTDIEKYILDNYSTSPEHLWKSDPASEIFRHNRNRKWFGLIMNITGDKVNLDNNDYVDVLNLKCDPEMISHLASQKGFAPAYHMSKKHWITIVLNGDVNDDIIYNLIDQSYNLTT